MPKITLFQGNRKAHPILFGTALDHLIAASGKTIENLLLGSFSTLLTDQSFFVSTAWDQIGQNLAKLLLIIVIPLQAFDVTELLSTGELIEFSLIWRLFFNFFILRGLPLFLFGMWMYRKRELGLAVRK